jgi:hypothetical protein
MFDPSALTFHEGSHRGALATKPNGKMAHAARRDDARRAGTLPFAQEALLHRRLADPNVLQARIYCWGGAVLRQDSRGGLSRGVQIEVVPLRLWARLGEACSYEIVTRSDWQRGTLALARGAFGRLPSATTLAYGGPSRDALGHCLVTLLSFGPTPERDGWIDLLLGGTAMTELLRSVERAATFMTAAVRAPGEHRLAFAA